MKTMRKALGGLVLAACANAAPVLAADAVLQTPVTYHPDAGVVQSVREQCGVEQMLEREIGGVLSSHNAGGKSMLATGQDPQGAELLRVRITHVLGVGGGAWSGPKSLTIDVELLDKGKVLRHTRLTRSTTGGAFGGFKGTCSLIERCATTLAKDVGAWAYQSPAHAEAMTPSKEDNPASPSQ